MGRFLTACLASGCVTSSRRMGSTLRFTEVAPAANRPSWWNPAGISSSSLVTENRGSTEAANSAPFTVFVYKNASVRIPYFLLTPILVFTLATVLKTTADSRYFDSRIQN
ncbi:hypothetical protein M422DRAFT_255617 [Sphaerobolus stellatus SS14]|uniref:Unplaced genomic scaffold SPHSTscaffold_62, whole genome shotgun sequence n=1 Tax=Sphaerobolus stellatus (strain SS14) TaxID=990650 RepID=A0A0C9VSL8_SPHS4|nr:hypothetical protein M422DRAFT_255617 [Sphaerobolus stellatus SS14]